MSASQKVVFATFESGAERIRDSLAQIEEVGEPLDPWQSDMLARALAYLRTGNYALAMEAAFQVSRPQFYRTSTAVIALSGGPTVTTAEVRVAMEQLLADRAA